MQGIVWRQIAVDNPGLVGRHWCCGRSGCGCGGARWSCQPWPPSDIGLVCLLCGSIVQQRPADGASRIRQPLAGPRRGWMRAD